MEREQGEIAMQNNDYFADRLLGKLETADPVFAAFEAQDVSRDVGFDFADFQDVVPRALDEIRETKEAYSEEGPEARDHFGDEIADIMFSLVNLARHAGRRELPALEQLMETASTRANNEVDTLALIDDIGERISIVAEAEKASSDEFPTKMDELFQVGMEDSILLAWSNGFQPEQLLKENVRKYLVRCQAIETLAEQDSKQWSDLAENNEIIDYWKKAKVLLK